MLSTAHVLVVLVLTTGQSPQLPSTAADLPATREQRIAALRATAKEHIEQERTIYSAPELDDIDARYRSAHVDYPWGLLRRDAGPILRQLVADYPKSNRAGCAALRLARQTSGDDREQYLKDVIRDFSGAWCESGAQVGAVARALLAVHYAGLEKYDEAERWAKEMLRLFPGAIEESGAPLDDVLTGIQLLRRSPPRGSGPLS